MKKLCLGASGFTDDTCRDIIEIGRAGLDAFFTNWERGEDVAKYANIAKDTGLIYQSVHAPFGNAHLMWEGDDKGTFATNELIECLQATADISVPLVIMHAFIGFDRHNPTQIGVDNFGKVLRRAEQLGIKIALENTEGEEYLDMLLTQLKSPYLGFCWDSGHETCYNRSRDLLADYGNVLFATHLNDNLGIRTNDGTVTWLDDIHLLPFDGIADWNSIAQRLAKANCPNLLTFELLTTSKPNRHDNDVYLQMPLQSYLKQAYLRATKIAHMIDKQTP